MKYSACGSTIAPLSRFFAAMKGGKMKGRKLFQQVVWAFLIALMFVGCGVPAATPTPIPPTATPIPGPPTATPTPGPPTATHTSVPPTTTPTLVPPTAAPSLTLESDVKILFVGNSLIATYEEMGRKGLDLHLKELALSATPPMVIETEAFYYDGATLKTMWGFSRLHELISEGEFDVVILQGYIPISGVETFKEYVRKFDDEIKESWAKTMLYMTWGFGFISTEEIAQAHDEIATELGIEVAPVGLAIQRLQNEQPEWKIFYDEGEHPHLIGSYLAVNVVYATLFGESPIGLTYQPYMEDRVIVSKDMAEVMQYIAWETVQEYQAQDVVPFPKGEYLDEFGNIISFEDGDKFTVTLPDGTILVEEGQYTIDGDIITFLENEVCPPVEGVYRWSVGENGHLNFELVEENCEGRTFEAGLDPLP